VIDPARLQPREREIYDAGLAAGRAEQQGPKWTKPTFALAVLVTLFAMWLAGYLITHTADPSLELVLALIAAVSAVPIAYAWPRKPEGE
jgi:hypothetical protein